MVASFCTLYPTVLGRKPSLTRIHSPTQFQWAIWIVLADRVSGLTTAAAKSAVRSPGRNSRHSLHFLEFPRLRTRVLVAEGVSEAFTWLIVACFAPGGGVGYDEVKY